MAGSGRQSARWSLNDCKHRVIRLSLSYGRLIKSRVLCKITSFGSRGNVAHYVFRAEMSMTCIPEYCERGRSSRIARVFLCFRFARPMKLPRLYAHLHTTDTLAPVIFRISRRNGSREFLLAAMSDTWYRDMAPASRKFQMPRATALEKGESLETARARLSSGFLLFFLFLLFSLSCALHRENLLVCQKSAASFSRHDFLMP